MWRVANGVEMGGKLSGLGCGECFGEWRVEGGGPLARLQERLYRPSGEVLDAPWTGFRRV